MNAPTHYSTLAVEILPISSIIVSRTPEQARRRATFSDAELADLADSIRPTGVLQPILVRPINNGKYEIVAGERRYLASQIAGFDTIPANIREMDDGEVLFAQIVENLQRKGLTALEEAEGYKRLMHLRQMNADAVGKLIGKSRAYVYTRTKLLDLCPEGQDALAKGEIDASTALLFARLPSPKLQKKVIAEAASRDWTYRDAARHVEWKCSRDLTGAPFSLHDDTIEIEHKVGKFKSWGKCPACAGCEFNSDNDPELKAKLGADERICINVDCFDAKCSSFMAAQRATLQAAGITVISGVEARDYDPNYWHSPWADLDKDIDSLGVTYDEVVDMPDQDQDPEGFKAWQAKAEEWEAQTIASVIADAKVDIVHVDNGKKILRLVKRADIAPIFKKKLRVSISVPDQKRDDEDDEPTETPEQRAAREAKEAQARQIEQEYRQRLFLQVANKIKAPLKKPDLVSIARFVWDHIEDRYDLADDECGERHMLETLFGTCPPPFDKLSEAELLKLLLIMPLLDQLDTYNKPGQLLDLATRHKIDAKKLKATVTAEIKAAAAEAKKTTKK